MHPYAGVLVRQISLGINGRYKTPLAQCNIMDYNYTYNIRGYEAVGAEIDGIFGKWKDAGNLRKHLIGVISRVLNGDYTLKGKLDRNRYYEITGDAYRETRFNDIDEFLSYPFLDFRLCIEKNKDVLDFYSSVFVDRDRLKAHFSDFWKTKLGFRDGAARSLYSALADLSIKDNRNLVVRALDFEHNPGEKQKLQDILEVEPFLACFEFLFQVVVAKEIRSVSDVEKTLEKTGFYQRFPHDMMPKLIQKIKTMDSTFPRERLTQLCEIPVEQGNLRNTLSALFDYHKNIMDYRGLFPWFMVDDKGRIQHTAKMYSLSDLDNRTPTDWIHDYYMSSLKSLRQGIEVTE